MKSVAEALATMMPHFRRRPAERVGLAEALGRCLAADVSARLDLPAFDNSAMDGYALAFDPDCGVDTRMTIVGESRAGGPPPPALKRGCAMRIFTGAPVPLGADTVLIQENTVRSGQEITLTQAPTGPGQHVRSRGTDVARGDALLPAGQALGPGEIAVLAAQGLASADVHRRPRVAILSTGDELRDVGQAGEPGTIVNTNVYSLAAQVREAGGDPWVLPTCPDDLDATTAALHTASAADVIVTAGGVSVGDYDLVGQAFARAGVTTHFWKVAIKPGKPLLFGTLGDTPLVGLPGNPVSAMITFEVFVRPGLRRMVGSRAPYRATHTVVLSHEHRRSPGRLEFARARLDHHQSPARATLHATQGSGALRSMCDVHALVILPPERTTFAEGEALPAIFLFEGDHTSDPRLEHAGDDPPSGEHTGHPRLEDTGGDPPAGGGDG